MIFRVPIGAYLACSMAWGWEHPALPGNIAVGVVRAAPLVLCRDVGLLLPLLITVLLREALSKHPNKRRHDLIARSSPSLSCLSLRYKCAAPTKEI